MASSGFNSGTYEIYWYKDQNGTPNAPQSPTTSIAQSPVNKNFNIKKAAAIGIGAVVARRAFNTLRNELIATTGNEALETNINNAMKLVGYATTIGVGGIAGTVMVGADVALNAITYYRNNRRENIKLEIDRQLKGKKVNIASGSVYYD